MAINKKKVGKVCAAARKEKGKKYVVDREYRSGGSVVTVLHSGRLFARVRNEAGYERDVMTDRLSEYKGEEEKKND